MKTKEKIGFVIVCAIIAGFAIAATVVRFANPELTETQLFLRFWPLWLSMLAACFGGIVVVTILERK